MSATDVAKTLAGIASAGNTIFSFLPLLMSAYEVGYNIWKQSHSDGSFEEYNAHLMASSQEVSSIAGKWLREHGWTQDSDGAWVKP